MFSVSEYKSGKEILLAFPFSEQSYWIIIGRRYLNNLMVHLDKINFFGSLFSRITADKDAECFLNIIKLMELIFVILICRDGFLPTNCTKTFHAQLQKVVLELDDLMVMNCNGGLTNQLIKKKKSDKIIMGKTNDVKIGHSIDIYFFNLLINCK